MKPFNLLRFTNSALLAVMAALTLTGVYGLFWALNGWMFDLHRLLGWGLIALVPWKTAISLGSLRRGLRADFDRGIMILVSLLLAGVTLLVIGLGLAWLWRLAPGEAWLRQTLISWHWMLGLGLLAPFLLHAWRRWPRPRKTDLLSRRAALKVIGVGGAALVSWWAGEAVARWRALPAAPRRFTGSREEGSFMGNAFPVTHGPNEGNERIDALAWRLAVQGPGGIRRSLAYNELLALPRAELTATVDCTLGWYTTQVWSGCWLRDLLGPLEDSGALAIRLESITGYAHVFPLAEAQEILLATHVGEEVLAHAHGFPLRAVIPTRRGWFWVKWITRIAVSEL
jgi:hypothetical protein